MDRALLHRLLSEGLSLAEIGRRFGVHESTVSYWLARHGLQAAYRDKHAPRGPLSESRLRELVAAGLSVRAIAKVVDRSPGSVRHWLATYGMTTSARLGRPASAEVQAALAAGLELALLHCPRHGRTQFQLRPPRRYRCLKCRSEAVTRRRRRVKQLLVEEAGGACAACGTTAASGRCTSTTWTPRKRRLRSAIAASRVRSHARGHEAEKCVLLCGNCHAEVEAGLRMLPDKAGS